MKKVEIKKEDLEDLGNCSSCEQPLKRTAYNRIMDAVRCVNPRCMMFREIFRRIHRREDAIGYKPQPKSEPKPYKLAMSRLDEKGQALLSARSEEIIALAESEEALRYGPGTEANNEQRAEILVNIVQQTLKEEGSVDGRR